MTTPMPGATSPTGGQVNTMAGSYGVPGQSDGGGLRVLARLLGVLVLLASLVLPYVVIGGRAGAALVDLRECTEVAQAACLTGETVTTWIVVPLLSGATAFSAAIGAFVDSRPRPLIAVLLAVLGAVALVLGASQ